MDIRPLLIRNKEGNLVALEDVVSVYEGMGLNVINRLNRQRSVTITANLESNKPLGTAVQEINAIAKQILPQGYLISLSGKAETFKESFDSLYFAFILALIFTYIILASLFENFIHPFTVLLSIPLSMIGALGILLLTGNTINIFSMIGIILLMSIVTKNSILLVDYTNTLRGQGYARNDAVLQASPVRLRPILMTAFSTIFGIFPIVFGIGPGSETRNPMAIATVGGIFSSLLLTLIVVPVVYTLLDDLVLKFTKKEAG
ncbi:MAG: efflux RND transporter permease subunit [Planctomycetota bacterium]